MAHMRSFERVTGPKRDEWLVNTVGALVATTGAVVGLSARHERPPLEVVALATGSALALAGVDVYYVARRRIAPIYLADALLELCLVAAWARALAK